jgi:outer membrane protein insertion porin family
MTLIGSKLGFDFELPEWTYFTGFKAYLNFENTKVFYIEDYMVGLISDLLGIIDTSSSLTPSERDSLAAEIVNERGDELLKTNTNNSVLGVDLNANKTNDILFPSRGYTLNLLLESGNVIPRLIQSALGEENLPPLYGKVLLSSTAFPAVYYSRESSFGLKIRVGNIFADSQEKFSIPFNQRFTVGGSNSVRGWASRQLVPALADQDFDFEAATPEDLEALARQGATLGGYFLIEGSIETRNRLIGQLGTALFLDFGNTYIDHTDMRLDNIAIAVGFGFRYYTEIIPIRIDFGFKAYDPSDPRSFFTRLNDPNVGLGDLMQFHFAIGEAF